MRVIILLIIVLVAVGFLLFLWAGKNPEKRQARMQTINFIANIATIIGIIVAVVALFYAYSQYRVYKTELAKRPYVDLQIDPITRPDDGVFHVQDSNDYSNVVKMRVTLHNKGSLFTNEVWAAVIFNEKVKVLSIDDSCPGFELPMKKHQLFTLTNRNFPLPPDFIALTMFQFSGRLQKVCFKAPVIVGCYYVIGGGEKCKSFSIEFEPRTESFRPIPRDPGVHFKAGPLHLIQE